ncbi:hypothetical protein BDD12DRAFT_900988 [Trichophaea hybrida]|nr:hypothetical protein BDD12DRAFT_900988 [Trichophaea hybrida]
MTFQVLRVRLTTPNRIAIYAHAPRGCQWCAPGLIHDDVTRQRVRAAEGAAADKDLSAAMLYDLRSKSKDVSAAAVKDRRQLTKARVITAEEVKKQGATAESAATGTAKGKEKEVIDLENMLEELHMSGSDGSQIVGEDGADFGGSEGKEDSFVHIDDILGQGSAGENGEDVIVASMVGERVEVVTRCGRRARHVIYG